MSDSNRGAQEKRPNSGIKSRMLADSAFASGQDVELYVAHFLRQSGGFRRHIRRLGRAFVHPRGLHDYQWTCRLGCGYLWRPDTCHSCDDSE